MKLPIMASYNASENSIAVVFGASGGIGSALARALRADARFAQVLCYSRQTTPAFDLLNEDSLRVIAQQAASHGAIRLAIDATGFLHDADQKPEKSIKQLSAAALARAFALNATGPALLMKHLLPLMPREGKAVFASLSARVGSIADNQLGGWYAYRASKAALNQLIKTAAIESARRNQDLVCLALHPGTVATRLSEPFAAQGLHIHTPDEAARHLLAVIDQLGPDANGGFYDWRGHAIAW